MSLAAGTRLGPYKVVEPIGKGGVGEVYRARDTKLERDVAIKVLPEEFAKDKERLARFEREAKLLASLNHPNIASIYGLEESDGVKALVLELVEGPTLAERIAEGPIPVEEALPISRQIAEALEAGHEAGVIHRDLKPANVKVKEDGTVKVLDYGLAKELEGETPHGADSELSQSPTLTRQGTQVGVILGTAAYMSPEQAKGKRVDKRTDIFSFGCVLYEMLTGNKTFDGETAGETLAAVIKTEPEWEALPTDLSPTIRKYLTRYLEKDPKRRVRDIGDVRLAMEGAFETEAATEPTDAKLVLWQRPLPALGVAVLLVVAGLVVGSVARPATSSLRVSRTSIDLPQTQTRTNTGRRGVAVSPTGTHVVYVANEQLYLRAINEIDAKAIGGTEGSAPTLPFFSPDGQWIGFYSVTDGQLKKIALTGGAAVTLCSTRNPFGASWGPDDIVFGQDAGGIFQVSAAGGTPELLISVDADKGERAHGPQILPDGRTVLFTLAHGDWNEAQIVVQSLDTGERQLVIEGGTDARYLPTGHLVYALAANLLAVPFDLNRLEVIGGPVPLVENVSRAGFTGGANFDVSRDGMLVYLPGGGNATRTLVWVDRDGREEALAAEPRAYTQPRISPDGSQLALAVQDQEHDIWIWDFAREPLRRLTFAPSKDSYPVWTPDGKQVAFNSDRDGKVNLYWKVADGTGAVERLTESEKLQFPSAFTADGRQLVFFDAGAHGVVLGVLSLDGSSEPLLATEFSERNGEISPGGRWLAYESNASGQYEIYVRPFPNVEDGHWLISSGGGTRPLWAPDGRELFYMAPGAKLMTVDVQTEPTFAPGNAEEILGGYFVGEFERNYDISPDGERFLMIKESASDQTSSTKFILVQNWFEELKRLVPTNH